jgi:uncharacterized delta-60 repeat protein
MLFNRNSNLQKKVYSLLAIILCLGLMASLSNQNSYAQIERSGIESLAAMTETPGFIDDSFKPVLGGAASTINRTLVQPDGKILVAGFLNVINGSNKNGIARFNADGTLDNSFNTKSGANGSITAIGLQSDGKIIIGGNFSNYGGQPVGNIARLNADGSFDTSFNSSGVYSATGANGAISEISVLPDNKIYIGGGFTSYNGTTINRLARLNVNGNLDTTFVVGTGPSNSVTVIKQYTGGKILIGGNFGNYNGTASLRIARINSDGTYDTSFVVGAGASGQVRAFAVQPDDKIIIGGNFATLNGVAKNGIARWNADGSDDTSFSVSGTGANVGAVVRQSDGKLIVGGTFTAIAGTTRQSIARLNADGTFDATFDAGTGLSAAGLVNDLALQTDSKVVLVGVFTAYNGTTRGSIARANTDGTLEAGLSPTSSLVGNLNAIVRQSDGKILISGTLNSVNGTARGNIARLNADGTLDTSFDPGTGANAFVTSIGIQSDGKIIIGGNFTSYNGTAINRVARLNADGSLDMSFNPGTGLASGDIYTIAFQTDGKILIGGLFTAYNAVTVGRIVRLNTDGSLDTSFATGTGANSSVRKIVVQPDGKIMVGGDFATFNGVAKTRLMRLNADGTDDTSFNTGTGLNNSVRDLVRHADGKIVIVGSFTTVNGTTRNRAARLNADGSLDTTFDPGAGFATDVYTIVALSDGKYIVGGVFTTVAGLPRNRIARLKANGNLDPKFVSGLGPIGANSPQIRTIVPHNGKFLVGGQFDIFNTSSRSGLVMMSNTTKAPVDFDGDGKTDWAIARHYGGPGRWTYWINFSSTGDYTTFDYGIFTQDALQPGDYDGDGRTDVAHWRGGAVGGYWITFSTTNSTKFIPFGLSGDRALVEDYDGDGKDDMSVWREPGPSTIGQATWFYQGSLNNPNNNVTYFPWGIRYGTQFDQVDDPYNGDFDGDGKADFRIQRRLDTTVGTLSTPAIFYTYSTSTGTITNDYFGWAGDRIVPGDYDGDGKTDLCVSRGFNIAPSTTTWYIRYTGGSPDAAFQWGAGALDQFAQGDYDGDGTTDPTVYRRAGENNFYVRRSSDQMMQTFHWGQDDAICGPACDIAVATYNNR